MSQNVPKGKRDQLVEAAASLFHRQGVEATSLKDVAKASRVPLGSVYYYYPTKDDLTAAVIERRRSHVARLVGRHTKIANPADRLIALVDVWMADREIDARYGCPIGSLCFEVARARRLDAAAPFQTLIDWCSRQFRALGAGREAERYAVHLLAALQGISMVASVLSDPRLIEHEAACLRSWVRTLAGSARTPRTSGPRRAARRGAKAKRSASTGN
ncbi:MAG: TetR/AcrR family transcriptional regulator [Pseudomonadota bacterium]